MTTMLDIAGGILIAAIILGAFSFGVHLVTWRDPELPRLRLPLRTLIGGYSCILASSIFTFWLVLIRAGVAQWRDFVPH